MCEICIKIFNKSDIAVSLGEAEPLEGGLEKLGGLRSRQTECNVFNQSLDIHAPKTEIKSSKSRTKYNTKLWITSDMLKLGKSKDKTYQQFIKEKDPTAGLSVRKLTAIHYRIA